MIFGAFERMVALRYLRARRQEGFISVIAGFSLMGIALGVATLIIVMSVMNGFRAELLERVLGLNGHLLVQGHGQTITDFDTAAGRIHSIPGVTHVFPLIDGQALVTQRGRASGAVVRGMRAEDFARKPVVSDQIVRGSLDQFNRDSVIIGSRMAARLGLGVGDELTLVSPTSRAGPFGTMPRSRSYRIAAIFNVGMFEYDNSFVFTTLDAAQRFFDRVDTVTSLEVFVDEPTDPRAIRLEVNLELRDVGRTLDWQQTNASFVNALQVERNVMFLILTLIIVVAAFNIISSLIMLVKDKGRDIAILRTMGATRGMVMRVFFLTGASIGVVGTIAGFGLGVAFAENIETIRQWIQTLTGGDLFAAEIYFLSQLPAKMDWSEVVTVVAMALGLSFAATLYPAWRAARLDPVEALRYE